MGRKPSDKERQVFYICFGCFLCGNNMKYTSKFQILNPNNSQDLWI